MRNATFVLFLITTFLGLALLVSVPIILIKLFDRAWPVAPPAVEVTSTGPTVEELVKLAQLVSLRVPVSDVMTANMPDGSYKGAWVVKGDALIMVDLAEAEFLNNDEALRKVTVRLPQPRVVSPRIDHEKTVMWDMKATAWLPYRLWYQSDPSVLLEEAMNRAQKVVELTARSDEYIAEGRKRTELLIKGFYERVGWTVDVQWAQTPTETLTTELK
jgi:hypothetical protein